MQKVYTEQQIRQLEKSAIAAGITGTVMMERAGQVVFDELKMRWPNAVSLCVLCGGGNNGGDGYVVAQLAKEHGLQVAVHYLGDLKTLKNEALAAKHSCEAAGVSIRPFDPTHVCDADILVDALVGIGLKGRLNELALQCIHWVNQQAAPVLAVDIPSGVYADTGAVADEAVHADCTVTFIALKQGLFTSDALDYCGEILCHDLALPESLLTALQPNAYCVAADDFATSLTQRHRNAHKGDFGHVCILGGDQGMPGAPWLAALGAARVGTGLVTIGTRLEHITTIQQPEFMCHGIQTPQDVLAVLERANVVVIGPGLGQSAWSEMVFETVISTDLPCVVDADALHWLAQSSLKRDEWILTPHPGEAARLLNTDASTIQQNRFRAVNDIQMQYGGCCVLKGAGTLIKTLDTLNICTAGNPGMATGGMGDLLSGIIAGLVAQHIPLPIAAKLGVCLHSEAGDHNAASNGEYGMLATDLLMEVRKRVNNFCS